MRYAQILFEVLAEIHRIILNTAHPNSDQSALLTKYLSRFTGDAIKVQQSTAFAESPRNDRSAADDVPVICARNIDRRSALPRSTPSLGAPPQGVRSAFAPNQCIAASPYIPPVAFPCLIPANHQYKQLIGIPLAVSCLLTLRQRYKKNPSDTRLQQTYRQGERQ